MEMAEKTEKKHLFYIEFQDGYSFRNLIDYLKMTNPEGNFTLYPDKIVYIQSNDRLTILNDLLIDVSEIRYEYNSTEEFIHIGLKLNDFRSITQNIGKKDGLRLFMHNDEKILYVQINSPNTRELNQNSINTILPHKVEAITHTVPPYETPETMPNCSTPIADFCKTCTRLHKIKGAKIYIYGESNQIKLQAGDDGNIVGGVAVFKNMNTLKTPSLEDNKIGRIRVEASTIKSLSKLANLCVSSSIKIIMEAEQPLKIIVRVGVYGILRIYIEDCDSE